MSVVENKAVFLSYASQDAEAARRIAEALRAVGVEVWFDQNELVGGDAWDAKIRKQIAACALFVPVISATTDARPEGYFRLEWLLAVERARLMADDHPFLFPVAVGEVHEGAARVPEKFRAVQWTPLRDDASLSQFAELIRQVLHSAVPAPTRAPDLLSREAARPVRPTPPPQPRRRWPWLLLSVAVAATLLAVWWPRPAPVPAPKDSSAATVAVLPFVVARSVGAEVEIAETLHDDVISALARIRALRVLSREAVLPYREGAQRNHRTVAQQLGASAIVDVALRSENARLRLDARLLNAHTGVLEWSDTLEAEIDSPGQRAALAGALTRKIAAALHVTPTGAEEAALSRTFTNNAEAYALYQRAHALRLNYSSSIGNRASNEEEINLLRAALAKDPNLTAAGARLVEVHAQMSWFGSLDRSPERKQLAREALDRLVRVAPDAPETQLVRGIYLYRCERDFRRALEAFHDAEQSLHGEGKVKRWIGFAQRRLGRFTEALVALEEGLLFDPRDRGLLETIIETCFQFRRFDALLVYAARYREIGGRSAVRYIARAAYETSGDKVQFEKDMFPHDEASVQPSALRARYGLALLRGDFAAAAGLLDEPRLWPELKITRGEPSLRLDAAATVHRAYLAVARSDREAAKAHANEALKQLAREIQTEDEGHFIRVAMAEMMAIAGRGEEAVVAMKKVLVEITKRDAFEGMKHQHRLACVYAVAGMPNEALQQLAKLMQQPCDAVPSELREEPMLVSLRALPEFERILASARKL